MCTKHDTLQLHHVGVNTQKEYTYCKSATQYHEK